jgi:hypothetical protein
MPRQASPLSDKEIRSAKLRPGKTIKVVSGGSREWRETLANEVSLASVFAQQAHFHATGLYLFHQAIIESESALSTIIGYLP